MRTRNFRNVIAGALAAVVGAGALIWTVNAHRQTTVPTTPPAIAETATSEPGYTPSEFSGVYVRNIPRPSSSQTAPASLRKLPGVKLGARPHAAGTYIRPKPRIVAAPVPGGGTKAVIDDSFMVADRVPASEFAAHKSH